MTNSETVPYVARFPEGHEHAGLPIGRKAVCARCQTEYRQVRINPDYLESIRANRGEMAKLSFLGSCEQINGNVYQPAFCPRCTRKQIRPHEPVPPHPLPFAPQTQTVTPEE